MNIPLVFRTLLLGELLTFDFIPVTPHIITGFVVLILSMRWDQMGKLSTPAEEGMS
jgi:hypothetical protein